MPGEALTRCHLQVNGTSVGVNASIYNEGQCIVDSGTTDLALPHSAYIAFYNLLQQACSAGKNLVGVCGLSFDKSLFGGYEFTMTQNDVAAFPTLTVVLVRNVRTIPSWLPLIWLGVDAGRRGVGPSATVVPCNPPEQLHLTCRGGYG
mgnify:CR=1 FL=1